MSKMTKAGSKMLTEGIYAEETEMQAKRDEKADISDFAGNLVSSLKPLTEQVPSPGGEILGGLADFASGFSAEWWRHFSCDPRRAF